MKKEEESGEAPAEKRENLGEKLRRVGKRGGHSTPVASFWRPKELQEDYCCGSRDLQDYCCSNNNIDKDNNPFQVPCFSARKLVATVWELHHYKQLSDKMHHGGGGPLPRLRRLNHQQVYKDDGGVGHLDPSPSSPDLPGSSSTLRRHVASSLMQHHRSTERNNHAMQPVSPASYGSSMEITPYNPAITPSSSIELKGKTGSLRTSTELLKVLNRIWSLEEQHVSNMSLVKAMKKELDHSRSQIKALMREHQIERQEMDELMKQIAEGKLVRKNNKEQDRVNAAIQSMRNELEDERKLRKRSESLHRKLARELYDVKTTLDKASKELESEKNSRNLLEELCDEFALGIRDYDKQVHGLRQRFDKDWTERDDRDQLILHVSESWLDERMQMKLQNNGHGFGEKKSVVEKLSGEIEAFLRAKRSGNANNISVDQVARDRRACRRSSLESIPLNLAVSAPRDEDDEEEDEGSDSNCFELQKMSASTLKYHGNEYQKSHNDETVKQRQVKKKVGSFERATGSTPSNLQLKFEEQIGESADQVEDRERIKTGDEDTDEISISKRPEKCEATKENSSEGISGLNSNHMIENLIRNHHLLSESGSKQPDKDYGAASSIWRSQPSPVRQWTEKLPSHDLETSEASLKMHPKLKENTLKAKLFEARTRGQRSHSRVKGSIIPSRK